MNVVVLLFIQRELCRGYLLKFVHMKEFYVPFVMNML